MKVSVCESGAGELYVCMHYTMFDAHQIKSSPDSIIFECVCLVCAQPISEVSKQVNRISSLIAHIYGKAMTEFRCTHTNNKVWHILQSSSNK